MVAANSAMPALMTLASPDLVGAWELVTWVIDHHGAQPTSHPYGENASGQIIYSADGRMSAVIAQADRRALSTASPREAPAAECRDAMVSFFCYAGSWELDGDTVIHRLTLALNPAMLGTEQRREARLTGDLLELSAEESLGAGRRRTHRIQWRRVGA